MSGDLNTPDPTNVKIDWPDALAANRRWLRMVVFARVNNAHVADEVLQEVAAYVVKQRPVLSDPSKVQPWLYRVAVRQALLYRRRTGRDHQKNKRFVKRRRGDAECLNGRYDPLRWILVAEQRELVRKALKHLDPADCELLLLKYTENWTCRELAERLGVQVTTIENRLKRARQLLRRELARFDITEVSI